MSHGMNIINPAIERENHRIVVVTEPSTNGISSSCLSLSNKILCVTIDR